MTLVLLMAQDRSSKTVNTIHENGYDENGYEKRVR